MPRPPLGQVGVCIRGSAEFAGDSLGPLARLVTMNFAGFACLRYAEGSAIGDQDVKTQNNAGSSRIVDCNIEHRPVAYTGRKPYTYGLFAHNDSMPPAGGAYRTPGQARAATEPALRHSRIPQRKHSPAGGFLMGENHLNIEDLSAVKPPVAGTPLREIVEQAIEKFFDQGYGVIIEMRSPK